MGAPRPPLPSTPDDQRYPSPPLPPRTSKCRPWGRKIRRGGIERGVEGELVSPCSNPRLQRPNSRSPLMAINRCITRSRIWNSEKMIAPQLPQPTPSLWPRRVGKSTRFPAAVTRLFLMLHLGPALICPMRVKMDNALPAAPNSSKAPLLTQSLYFWIKEWYP